MPRMPFIGVRISWLMLARNSLLARLAASAACVARRSSSSAQILAELGADGRGHFQQPFIHLARIASEEFHHAQEFPLKHDGHRKRPLEPRLLRHRRAWKVR